MQKKTYVIWAEEVMHGVVTAENHGELKAKIATLLDGIREEIVSIELFPELDSYDESFFIVNYVEGGENDEEEFNIRRVEII